MKTITIEAADLVSIATLYNYGDTSRAPINEDLAGVMCSINANTLTAAATDRYTLATYTTNALDSRDLESEFKLPIAACKWIITNIKKGSKWATPAPVAIELNESEIAIQTENARATYALTPNKSLTIDKLLSLFDTWEPADTTAPLALGSKFLARITKLLDDFGRVEFATYELGKSFAEGSTNPGPVKVTAGNFKLLMQPRVTGTN